jgi:hypothetical protein
MYGHIFIAKKKELGIKKTSKWLEKLGGQVILRRTSLSTPVLVRTVSGD